MAAKIVPCERCGDELKEERPHRITIHKPDVEVTKDYKGKTHIHKVYRTERTIHLCPDCRTLFDSFMRELKIV